MELRKSGFRLLDAAEIDAVAGGLKISGIVTPNDQQKPTDPSHDDGWVIVWSSSPDGIDVGIQSTGQDGTSAGASYNQPASGGLGSISVFGGYAGASGSITYDLSSHAATGTFNYNFGNGLSATTSIQHTSNGVDWSIGVTYTKSF
jgi:hypothetical protein